MLCADMKNAAVRRDTLSELRSSGDECDLGSELAIFDENWSGIGNSCEEAGCCDGKDLHIQEPYR